MKVVFHDILVPLYKGQLREELQYGSWLMEMRFGALEQFKNVDVGDSIFHIVNGDSDSGLAGFLQQPDGVKVDIADIKLPFLAVDEIQPVGPRAERGPSLYLGYGAGKIIGVCLNPWTEEIEKAHPNLKPILDRFYDLDNKAGG